MLIFKSSPICIQKKLEDFVPIFLSKELLILSLILNSTKEDT